MFLNKAQDAVLEAIDGLVCSVAHLERLDGFPQVLPPRCASGLSTDEDTQ